VRIVFLNPSGELGGAETALLDLMTALRTVRPTWTLALLASAEGPLVARAARCGVQTATLTFPPSLARLGEWGSRRTFQNRLRFAVNACAAAAPAVTYTRRLRRALVAMAPDIVHTNGLKMHLLGARARPSHVKLIWHIHDYPRSRPLTARMLARHSHRCAAILANSDSVAHQVRDLVGPVPPTHTLYNSIDLERFSPDGARIDLDALAGLTPATADTLRVGLVATFARWKGHEVFLEAMARFLSGRRARGYVIGAPTYTTENSEVTLAQLRKMAAVRGLSDAIGFTGRIDDIPSAMRSLDIVVHASVEPEPFGLVIAEAMACARPLVVSKSGGAAEIAAGGALFHSPGNADELAARIDELATSDDLRRALGARGREIGLRLFSRQRLTDTVVPIYESLAGHERSPRP
jgi:glycosyltransferase involved in cell wall biosynthesis